MKSLRFFALAAALCAAPAAADTLVDNVQGISVDREGEITRFTGIWIDDDGRVKQLLQRKDKRPPRTDFAIDAKGALAPANWQPGEPMLAAPSHDLDDVYAATDIAGWFLRENEDGA